LGGSLLGGMWYVVTQLTNPRGADSTTSVSVQYLCCALKILTPEENVLDVDGIIRCGHWYAKILLFDELC
jgi:hypothetical protein